jgi:hypothetical protein
MVSTLNGENLKMWLDIGLSMGTSDAILAHFDGSGPDLGILSIEPNGDSNGRILNLKTGAAVNQCRVRDDGSYDGKWKCLAFIGEVPEPINHRLVLLLR